MKTVYKILILVGAIFAAVGAMLTLIFLANRKVFGMWSLSPLFFVAFGLCFIIPGIIDLNRNRKIIGNGKFSWDRDSVRQETLFDEKELMNGSNPGIIPAGYGET